MKILGIDPGTTRVGFGVVEQRGNKLIGHVYGCIRAEDCSSTHGRLERIYKEIISLIERYRPDAVAVESLFFNSNAKTAFAVGEARGVILLAAAHCGVGVSEYTPLEVKQAITGNGRAEKSQMQRMIQLLLSLPEAPLSDDAADALGIAVCHANSSRLRELVKLKR